MINPTLICDISRLVLNVGCVRSSSKLDYQEIEALVGFFSSSNMLN
jgi:hypothetical protein